MKDRSREIRQPLVALSFFQERERTPISQHFRLETSDGITVVTFSDAKVMPETKDPLYGLVEKVYNPASGGVTNFASNLPTVLDGLAVDASGGLYVLSRGRGYNTGSLLGIQFRRQ